MRLALRPLLAVALMALAAAGSVRADVFVLNNGGRIVGELLNPDESPREKYVIRTAAGAEVTLERSQIKQVLHPRPEELEYEKILPRYPDTAEGQWELAEWCGKNGLRPQREKHLRRVTELDPKNAKAWHALGYQQYEGKWMTQEEVMTSRGLIYHKGRWITAQEKQVSEEKEKVDVAEKSWMQKVNRLLVSADNNPDARAALAAIQDPAAVRALGKALKDNRHDEIRLLLAETLGKINTNHSTQALAVPAIEDPVPEIRLTCLEQLKKRDHRAAVDYFVGRLKHKDNEIVNRAGFALRVMGDPSAVAPLIDALLTKHKRLERAGNPGQTSASFSRQGGTGLMAGGGPVYREYTLQNQAVLDALLALTGGVNFGFDQRAWRDWYATQKRQDGVNTRRDEGK